MTNHGELYIGGVRQDKPAVGTYEHKVLQYLYHHRGDVCTKERLYYCAYRGKKRPPAIGEDGYEAPHRWQSGLENAISNLRRVLEPMQGKHTYITTKRGTGYALHHAE
jgi:DNA-binding winged helix-turn-helix (wHTH) protein